MCGNHAMTSSLYGEHKGGGLTPLTLPGARSRAHARNAGLSTSVVTRSLTRADARSGSASASAFLPAILARARRGCKERQSPAKREVLKRAREISLAVRAGNIVLADELRWQYWPETMRKKQ